MSCSCNAIVVDQVLLNAVTTGSTAYQSRSGSAPQIGYHHHIKWASGVTAGAVTIECADDDDYTGTWASMMVVTFSGTAPNQDYVYTPGRPKAIRHRVSTTVSGGASPSVTTRLVGSS